MNDDTVYVSDIETDAQTQETDSVEVISLSLLTYRSVQNGVPVVKKEHSFSTSEYVRLEWCHSVHGK